MQFWLREMELYYKKELEMEIVNSAIYGMAKHFFSAKSYDIWNEDVKWEIGPDGVDRIRSFRFKI